MSPLILLCFQILVLSRAAQKPRSMLVAADGKVAGYVAPDSSLLSHARPIVRHAEGVSELESVLLQDGAVGRSNGGSSKGGGNRGGAEGGGKGGGFRKGGGVVLTNCPQIEALNCPTAVWVEEMVRIDPSPTKTIVKIGCDKGYDAFRWMELWGTSDWNKTNWATKMRTDPSIRGQDHGTDADSDACLPHQNSVTASKLASAGGISRSSGQPTGVCVEPMPSNVQAVRDTLQPLGTSHGPLNKRFHIFQAAVVGNQSLAGATRTFLNGAGGDNTDAVLTLETVDNIMQQVVDTGDLNSADSIDILSIDTDGYDAEVLKGANATLEKVRYLEFEVHRDVVPGYPELAEGLGQRSWGTRESNGVKSTVERLNAAGFDCYWAGNNGNLAHILNCWNDDFENAMWAHAACVKRLGQNGVDAEPWSAVLKRFEVDCSDCPTEGSVTSP